LLSKCFGFVGKAYQTNPSGANEDTIMQLAHQLYEDKMEKRFELMHWWLLLKDVPKWETLCNESAEVASKRLRVNEIGAYCDSSSPYTPSTPGIPSIPINPVSQGTPIEEGHGPLCPIRRKATKRKVKEKVEDPIMDIMTE